jgi:molecular chaperone DnaK (HSP70)
MFPLWTDKTTGKLNRITFMNDKGCLSKEEIKHMLRDVEE